MLWRTFRTGAGALAGLVLWGLCFSTAIAAEAPSKPKKEFTEVCPQVVAERALITSRGVGYAPDAADPANHPLAPAIKWAREGAAAIEKLDDYSTTLVKRERINGKLNDYEQFFVKVRHRPFSVYLYYLVPEAMKGQEAIYVAGKNGGNLWAHTVGYRGKLIGTISLPPTGQIAMNNQRYPLTEMGVLNLTRRLIEVGEVDMQYGECEVKTVKNAKINGRSCTCIQVVHPTPRKNFIFHLARIFVDDELNIPVRYEAHDWPEEEGGKPQLIEEYTFLNIKVNNGFTDLDFDIKNPNYDYN